MLGHLTRTLALAEEFDEQGHDVSVAMNRTYSHLSKVLPPRIRVVPGREFHAGATRSFGPIRNYREDIAGDRANLESSDRMTKLELRRRGRRLAEIVKRDAAIVDEVRPGVIITDYHFTPPLLPLPPETRVFHISHILGYPSFHRRVMGTDFFPLDSGHILVPGLEEIEYASGTVATLRESVCGMFRWRGWQRLQSDQTAERSHVFLFFGSTGNAKEIVPWLMQTIPSRYRIATVTSSKGGDVERFLANTEVAFCHGGHGTVMECLFQRTPMVIFPHNIEQLEIGRQIERMRLGILIKKPWNQLTGDELGEVIENIRADDEMKASLEKYAMLLRGQDGPKRAVATVLRSLENHARD